MLEKIRGRVLRGVRIDPLSPAGFLCGYRWTYWGVNQNGYFTLNFVAGLSFNNTIIIVTIAWLMLDLSNAKQDQLEES